MTNRRNAFAVGPAARDLPSKTAPRTVAKMEPEVSREVAELSAFILDNPVFTDILGLLRAEAFDRFQRSALGPEGIPERETARHVVEALSTIESRLGAFAADFPLHTADERPAGD
jgi:hypothetical protein